MQLFTVNGWPSLLLLLASVLSLAIILERALVLRSKQVCPPALIQTILSLHQQQKSLTHDLESMLSQSPLGEILLVALKQRDASRELMKEAIEEKGRAVMIKLEKHLSALGTIAAVSPLIGLLGTVVGMIMLFGHDQSLGQSMEQMAQGISVALYNTAFGLAVAIPSMIFYRFYRSRIDNLAVEMEQQAIYLVDVMTNQGKHELS